MDISQLYYFQIVARNGNISRAAEQLHIAQPALSGSISRLEKALGVPLFDRTKNRIELNDYGRILLEHCENITEEYQTALHRIEALKNRQESSIHFGILLFNYSMRVLSPFTADHPEIRFYPEVLTHAPGADFDLEQYDLVYTPLPELFEDAVYIPTEQMELLLYVPPGHPCYDREKITLRDLNGEHVIVVGYRTHFSWFVDQTLKENNIRVAELIYATESSRVRISRENCWPILRMAGPLPDPSMKELSFDPPIYRANGFAYSAKRPINPATKKFLSYALEYFRGETPPEETDLS